MAMSKVMAGAPALAACPRDGTATRLTCARCGVPICPSCLVRTSVGMRCPDCTAAKPRRRTHPVLAFLATIITGSAAVVVGLHSVDRSGGTQDDVVVEDAPEAAASAIGRQVTVGRFTITVNGFDCAEQPGSGTAVKRCTADLAVRNDSLQTLTFPASLQRVDGLRRFVPEKASSSAATAPVNPGEVLDVALAFYVPAAIDSGRLTLRASSNGAVVALPVRL